MIEAMAAIFAGYASYTGWPWWSAAVVGSLCGFQVANARLYGGVWKERIEAGDQTASSAFFQASALGIIAGGVLAVAIFFATGYFVGKSA